MFLQRVKQEYIKTINNLINELCDEYDIYDRQTKEFVNKSQILNKILFKINSESDTVKQKPICNGIYKNGNRCNKVSVNNNMYCKRHLDEIKKNNEIQKYQEIDKHEIEKYDEDTIQKYNKVDYTQNKIQIENIKKVFIEDSFYLIDDKYIYDKDTCEKVGYIENENFIFTEDPFLLGNVF